MKRADIKQRPLADTVLKALEPEASTYREPHEGGVYFQVKPSGAKSWLFRYKRPDGRWNFIGLGAYSTTFGGPKARELAAEMRKLLAEGKDPAEERKPKPPPEAPAIVNPFREVAEAWYVFNFPKWAPATAEKCRTYLDKDILPILGHRPIADIGPGETAAMVESIEQRSAHNVARKVRQWLRRIFSYAIAKGLTVGNPASELSEIAAEAPKAEHHPHLLEPDLPAFLRALCTYGGSLTTRTAAHLVILTANRPGVVRAAEWCEFNLDEALWEIPKEKMKMRRPHLVPLPRQVVDMLRELQPITGSYPYLFPGQGGYGKRDGKFMSEGTINRAFARIGYKGRMTGHGSRHTASTLLHEHHWESKFIDAQLSHKDKDAPKIRGEYNHAIYLPQRREMMQWYADHLDTLMQGNVVEMNRARS